MANEVKYCLTSLHASDPELNTHSNFTLPQQTLENLQSTKYLGITITLVSDISSKATKTLGFICKDLAFAPRNTKEVAYKTLVHPRRWYAAPSRNPY